MRPVIFTDLDGTLLHPKTHSFNGAEQALARIKSQAIPLVLSSSKTRAEIERLRELLGNKHPFIAENGGAVYIPAGYFPFEIKNGAERNGYVAIVLGRRYIEVRQAFMEARMETGTNAVGFADMTDEEVAKLTGLDAAEAPFARQREFDEPFTLKADEASQKEFFKRIEKKGFNWTSADLFHIMGGHDKGKAVRILKQYYSAYFDNTVTIGIGDGKNDISLLKEVDYPVLVQKSDGRYEDVGVKGVIRADGIGPAGWNKAVLGILDSIDASYRGYTC